jgi:hypothetical protein
VQHGIRLARGRRDLPEQDVNLGVRLVRLGPASLAHLLGRGRLERQQQPGRNLLVFSAALLARDDVAVYDVSKGYKQLGRISP